MVGQNSANAHAEIGYGLLAMSQGVDNRKLDTLNSFDKQISQDILSILEKVKGISSDLNKIFSKMLDRHGKSDAKQYEYGLSTTFKTLSYFAALWPLAPHTQEYQQTLKNIKVYYVSDYLRGVWGAHGDSRLYDYYPQVNRRSYREPISEETLNSEFDRWLEEAQPGIRFGNDVKALVAIHANLTYLSGAIPQGDPYELEHVIAKKWIDAAEENPRKILGSSIGNCMYLPKSKNNSKKDKTLHDFTVTDANGKVVNTAQLMRESDYFSYEEFDVIQSALERREYDAVNDHIKKRARAVCNKITHALVTTSGM